MLIVFDKVTKTILNNMGTNSACPSGDLPYMAQENEFLVKLHDIEDSGLVQKIMNSYEFTCLWDEDDSNRLLDIIVTKTLQEHFEEQTSTQLPTIESRIAALEDALLLVI